MSKVIVVASPEASFRPERYIKRKVIEALREELEEGQVVETPPITFQNLNSQSLFYDDETMTKSFFQGIQDLIAIAENGDVVFFSDGWNPALPALKFHMHCSGLDIKMCGIFHSSVETPGDFLFTAGEWVRQLEHMIVNSILDKTFIATEYGRDKLPIVGRAARGRVVVTHLPRIYPEDTGFEDNASDTSPRENMVVFPHRWAEDKRVMDFILLAKACKKNALLKDTRFVVTAPIDISLAPHYQDALDAGIKFVDTSDKQVYWDTLAQAKWVFSSAELETFGYGVLEGIEMGCIPIVPRRACYPYMYAKEYIYGNEETLDSSGPMRIMDATFEEHNIHPQNFFLPSVFESINAAEFKIADEIIALMKEEEL